MRLLNELSRQQKTRTAVISTGQLNGAGEESRTPDLRITNALLYQLSHSSILIFQASLFYCIWLICFLLYRTLSK